MKALSFVVGLLLLFNPAACRAEAPQTAKAVLHDAEGEEVGIANFEDTGKQVLLFIQARHLPPGLHAFHIHEFGKCEEPDFKSAGVHFNPHGKKHGVKNPEGAHAGDLPNLLVRPDGIVKAELLPINGVTLDSGDHSLFHPGGTSLVLHANPDDDVTDPAGNAGTRIACGVIEK